MAHYLIDDLELKNGSEEEQVRTRKIFDDLKSKALKGSKLLEREKDFLCTCLKLTIYENDGKPQDFDICKDFNFKELYLTYFHNNLSGPFFKAKRGKVVEVGVREMTTDYKLLQRISDNWFKEIQIDNHKDVVLQELATETRKELKDLDKSYPRLRRVHKRQQDEYRLQKDKLILQSKFLYLLAKSVSEDNEQIDFEIPFSGEVIEFTTYSLIHIVSRHYAESIKNNVEKTYHYNNFHPKELHADLKSNLIEIDSKQLIDLSQTNNIIFVYKGIVYHLWIEKKTKQVKGIGNVIFNRIQTFYPIYDTHKIRELKNDYTIVELNSDLSVYVKK